MIYASCRKDFEDVNEFAPDVLVRVGGVDVPPTSSFAWPRLRSMVFVHGYNSAATNVMDAYRSNVEIWHESGIPEGASAFLTLSGFLWPGLGGNPLESLLFHKAQGMADKSAPFLAKWVGADSIVVTHSLGARVALEAIVKHGLKVRRLVLTGPAVDDACFEKQYAAARGLCSDILVFGSKRDKVLCDVFKIDQFKRALGCAGPRTPLDGVRYVDLTDEVPEHNAYRYSRKMWSMIGEGL